MAMLALLCVLYTKGLGGDDDDDDDDDESFIGAPCHSGTETDITT